jgi:hypothetical protein
MLYWPIWIQGYIHTVKGLNNPARQAVTKGLREKHCILCLEMFDHIQDLD